MPGAGSGRRVDPARSRARSFFPRDAMAREEAMQRRVRERQADTGQRYAQLVERDVLLHLLQAAIGRHANNRSENSDLLVRRRERAMLRFRRMKTLQKFASVHASVHNRFSQERHLIDRATYKERRSAAWAEWRSLAC